MRYCLLFIIFLSSYFLGSSQDLLVNGDFEQENICTEFQKNCAPEAWIGTAFLVNYYFDTEGWAENGTHFVGLIAGNRDLPLRRSFVRSRLLCGLRKGHKYNLEFYVRSRHPALDSIGVYFSKTDFLLEKRSHNLIEPSLMYKDTSAVMNAGNTSWKKVSFQYTATGEEIFITIGSFKKREYLFTLPPEYKGNYYFYLDAVTLIPEDRHELRCDGADSMRTTIYEENERHSLLERKIAVGLKNPVITSTPPLTRLQKIDTLIIPDILFATASAKLNNASFHLLDSFATAI